MKSFLTLKELVRRNTKVFFKDKTSMIMSMISPIILLVLFVTFLKSVYASSLTATLPEGFIVEGKAMEAFTAGWLLSSILGVTSVTLAFCSNIIMVTDKIDKYDLDFKVTPTDKRILSLSYFISNFLTTLMICSVVLVIGLVYLSIVGWFLTIIDVLSIILTMILCIMFGTLLAAIIETFISTQGAVSALATLVSSMYGFICGAYMPISQFTGVIQNIVAFVPGTYGTVLLRNHFMGGVINSIAKDMPAEQLKAIKDGFDSNIYFFGHKVETSIMYLILLGSVVLLLGIYLTVVVFRKEKKR